MRSKKTRGIALIMVLMAVVLCMMMLGAFLQANRNYTQLYRRGQSQDQVDDTTRSLFEFARSSLENDKSWGTPRADDRSLAYGQDLSWTEHRRAAPTDVEGRVTGELANGLVCRMDVLNNLRTSTTVDGVGGKCCRVKIALYENPQRLPHTLLLAEPENFVSVGGAQVTLRNASLYDSGIVASAGIDLHARKISLKSKDELSNQIRSNSHVWLPNLNSNNLDFAFLRPKDGGGFEEYEPRGYKGTVWAKDDILLGDDADTDAAKLAVASQATGGHFIPDAKTHYSIPQLTSDDFKVEGDVKHLSSGQYTFLKHWVSWGPGDSDRAQIPLLARMTTNPAGGIVWDECEFYYIRGDGLPGAVLDENIKLLAYNESSGDPINGIHFRGQAAGEYFEIPDAYGGTTGLRARLADRRIDVAPNTTIEVDGDFIVNSADRVTSDSWDRSETPVNLNFGVPELGDESWNRGSIKAKGNVVIEGFVQGKGNIISDKTVALQVNAVDVETDIDSDLAVYAKENVAIGASDNSGGTGKVSFKGLVYAEKNFLFMADADLEIEGALVARSGWVNLIAGNGQPNETTVDGITPTHDLSVIYNPDFLDSLLRPQALERSKVQLMAWRPGL